MAKVSEYIKESYIELTQKVTWPTWTELVNSAILVLIAALIIALIILVIKKCGMLTPVKQTEKRKQHSNIIKNAHKVFPQELKLFQLYY